MLGNGFLFLGIFSIIGLVIGGPIIDKFNTRKTALTALLPLLLALLVLLSCNNNQHNQKKINLQVQTQIYFLNLSIHSLF